MASGLGKIKSNQERDSDTTHHSDIQCASSTTTSDIDKVAENIDKNSAFRNLSGET